MSTNSHSTKLDGVPVRQVRLLDGPFKKRQDIHLQYLLAVEPDRLLAPFRLQAGLPALAERYGGWESRDISGHSLGHYLSAVCAMQAATGHAQLLARINHIVAHLAMCQEANGGAYVLPVAREAFEQLREGKIEASPFSLNGVWVPFYTLHKLLAGLRDAWRLAGNCKALEIEVRFCEWLDALLRPLSAEQIQEMLRCEHGGMNEVLADLAHDAKKKRFLEMALEYFHHGIVMDAMMRGEDQLDGLHGNTQIPKAIGLAREYELTGNPAYHKAATSFWETVVQRRSYAIGGHGESEHFFPPEQFPERLTPNTCETCNTYNMLKLTRHLFSWEPRAEHMDFVERALINHLAANIGEEPGEFGYFLGLGAVGVKVFSTPFDAWWCCVGTGLENPPRYGEQIYAREDETLWVNLYFASELNLEGEGVLVRQETAFPDEDVARFRFSCDDPWPQKINFRHPYWCEKPALTLNGTMLEIESQPVSYFSVERTWQDNDVLVLRLPMKLRIEPLPHSGEKILAPMYGPSVLAAIITDEPGAPNPAKIRFSEHLDARGKTDAFPPLFLADSPAEVLAHLKAAGVRFGEFVSEGAVVPTDLTFVPFHRIYEEQYAVYLPLISREEWQQREGKMRADREEAKRREALTIDRITPGYQQPEVEHELRSEGSPVSDFLGRKCRETMAEGWFSYRVKIDKSRAMTLVATYWGGEWLHRNFDILVEGERIATEKLRTNKPGDFFEARYEVPPALIKDKTRATITFRAQAGSTVGRLFELQVMAAESEIIKGLPDHPSLTM